MVYGSHQKSMLTLINTFYNRDKQKSIHSSYTQQPTKATHSMSDLKGTRLQQQKITCGFSPVSKEQESEASEHRFRKDKQNVSSSFSNI